MNRDRVPPAEPRRIVLTGFMGSGKSTVGRLLAERLGWQFTDLDDVIAQHHGAAVPQIFADHGEAHFRSLEVEALEQLLRAPQMVLALGGGAVETPRLRALLAASQDTRVVYLHAPFDLLYDRCARQALDPTATGRPLLGSRESAAQRHARREALYAAVGQTAVAADLPTPEAVAEAVLDALQMQVLRR